MKQLAVLIAVALLAGFLNACVPAQKYDNLKAQNDELEQAIVTQKRMGEDADTRHLATIADLEDRNLNLQRKLTTALRDLENQQSDLKELQQDYADLQRKYEHTSEELSTAGINSLAFIEEKSKLNATIITLQGEIATLKDTVKDLKNQLAKPAEHRTNPAVSPKSSP